jgi:hypothetical protein
MCRVGRIRGGMGKREKSEREMKKEREREERGKRREEMRGKRGWEAGESQGQAHPNSHPSNGGKGGICKCKGR